MDPNIGKATGKERTVAPCKESLPTSRGPHRNRFSEVQTEIRTRVASDKKTLFAKAHASAKRNLLLVGGCADTPVDLVGASEVPQKAKGDGGSAVQKRRAAPLADTVRASQKLLCVFY